MADKEVFGLPKILISFRTKSTTAIARSARGIGVIILNDENAFDADGNEEIKYFNIEDITDIPSSGISDKGVDLIKKALLGTPLRLHVYLIPPKTKTVMVAQEVDHDNDPDTAAVTTLVPTETPSLIKQADVLKKIQTVKWNYICHPTGGSQDQQDLSTWVKSQRKNKHKTFKAVVAHVDADDYGVVNFTTDKIRVEKPDYVDALEEADGDATLVPSTIPQYLTYSAAEYTARIMGVLLGLALDRSATYYELSEVTDVAEYDDIDLHINDGELCLIDEKDGNGVKIGRACNSLHTFTTDVGQDFRYIKIVEAVDLIFDDIHDTFRDEYVGKVINDYDHKMLFIAAISVYFNGLKGNVLDKSPSAKNYVEIDPEKNRDYAILHGRDVSAMNEQEILETNTGTNVFLRGRVTPVNAMEDLAIDFVMD